MGLVEQQILNLEAVLLSRLKVSNEEVVRVESRLLKLSNKPDYMFAEFYNEGHYTGTGRLSTA